MSVSPSVCQLVVFGGLPGVGKTAVARRVADRLGATFLRIDTIEAAIVSTLAPFEDNPVGYVVAAGSLLINCAPAGRSSPTRSTTWRRLARAGFPSPVTAACRCGSSR
jgi:hypothetical protein